MAVKNRGQLLTDNASVFGNGKNTRGDDEKTFNDDQLDSVVMKSGDTFEADAEFAFENGSKLREGAIDHGYGGGIARVCANEKADQWEDGFKYLILTSGSTNTVIYTENINNDNPDDNDDESLSYAVGSRWKNLVSGVEYLCTNADDGAADWVPLSGTYEPTVADLVELDVLDVIDVTFSVVGNIVSLHGRVRPSKTPAPVANMGATFTLPAGLRAKLDSYAVLSPIVLNTFSEADITAASITVQAETTICNVSFVIGASPEAISSPSIIFHLQYETDFL